MMLRGGFGVALYYGVFGIHVAQLRSLVEKGTAFVCVCITVGVGAWVVSFPFSACSYVLEEDDFSGIES